MIGSAFCGSHPDMHVDQMRVDRRRLGARPGIGADGAIVGGRPDRHAASAGAQRLEIGNEALTSPIATGGFRKLPVRRNELLPTLLQGLDLGTGGEDIPARQFGFERQLAPKQSSHPIKVQEL